MQAHDYASMWELSFNVIYMGDHILKENNQRGLWTSIEIYFLKQNICLGGWYFSSHSIWLY